MTLSETLPPTPCTRHTNPQPSLQPPSRPCRSFYLTFPFFLVAALNSPLLSFLACFCFRSSRLSKVGVAESVAAKQEIKKRKRTHARGTTARERASERAGCRLDQPAAIQIWSNSGGGKRPPPRSDGRKTSPWAPVDGRQWLVETIPSPVAFSSRSTVEAELATPTVVKIPPSRFRGQLRPGWIPVSRLWNPGSGISADLAGY